MHIKTPFINLFLCLLLLVSAPPAFSETADDSEAIDLPFKDEPFAIFMRPKALWLVANNGNLHITVDDFHKSSSHFVTDIKQISSPKALVFVLSLNTALSSSVAKLDNGGLRIILQR